MRDRDHARIGEATTLAGMSVSLADRTARAVHAQNLVVIDDAGHLPQVEQPAAFVDAVEAFVSAVHDAR